MSQTLSYVVVISFIFITSGATNLEIIKTINSIYPGVPHRQYRYFFSWTKVANPKSAITTVETSLPHITLLYALTSAI